MLGKLSAGGHSFVRDESGVSTVWALYWTVIFLITAGFVIDASNAYRYRVVLQATADSAALGAIMSYREPQYYEVYLNDSSQQVEAFRGREVAKKVATSIMGQAQNKIVVGDNQIEFGSWDGSDFTIETDPEEVDAAKVTALRTRSNGNELNTLLLNIFGGLNSWDVGAVAIAHYYKALCPQKEGIIAGGTLNIASNNTFEGDLCLHGELKVDMQQGNQYLDEVVITYGLNGAPCVGVCGEERVVQDYPALEDRLGVDPDVMPDIPDMFKKFHDAATDPVAAALDRDNILQEYIPEALVDVEKLVLADTDGIPRDTQDLLINPDDVASWKVVYGAETPGSKGGDQFEAYLADPAAWDPVAGGHGALNAAGEMIPLKPNTVYEVYGCGGDQTLTFDGAWLFDVVIVTNCRVDFTASAVMRGSTIITSYGDPSFETSLQDVKGDPYYNDYKGSPAFTGSNGTKIGAGTCSNPYGASKLIAAGDIQFGSGVEVMYSQMLTKGNLSFAAQGDGTQGTTAWAWGDVNMTSGGTWTGCDAYNTADQTIPFYYRLVY